MRRNYSIVTICALVFYGLLCLTTVSAEGKSLTDDSGKLQYDFDEVKVQYAAEFLAYPVDSPENNDSQPIHVLYGVVILGTAGGMKEEFIRVDEGTSFARGLSNGFSWDNYADANQDKIFSTEFVTGKTLEGNSVVKDYSGGWKTIKLTRTVDRAGSMSNISMRFSWDLNGASDPFFEELAGKVYVVDPSSMKYVGQQEVGP
ncbi:hypothetical protein D7Z26_17400 [Cohnella endophytica]|uniref:Uncharacterized protein n=1 Tax=Cohnella endophytica TaxID=2419778 RepID=A0A494XP33_9BACL|nr:hypothetical protein [Cohnella endophytica]RKP51562.1 hypothetical protein D7Z26_17400 [Cohnella endophytica]